MCSDLLVTLRLSAKFAGMAGDHGTPKTVARLGIEVLQLVEYAVEVAAACDGLVGTGRLLPYPAIGAGEKVGGGCCQFGNPAFLYQTEGTDQCHGVMTHDDTGIHRVETALKRHVHQPRR